MSTPHKRHLSHSSFADTIAGKPRSAAHNKSFLGLTIAFCLVTSSLYQHITIWIMAISLIAVIMRFFLYLGLYQHVPGTRLINLIGIVSGIALIVMSREMSLLNAMINLLIMASALKIMILHTQKDLLFIFMSVLFLCALGMIIHVEFVFISFYVVMLMTLLLTIASHFAPNQSARSIVFKTTKLAVLALPLAIILYMMIPHLPPFWHMSVPQQEQTGLTDTIKPGQIANLTQSSELAFIATFTSEQGVPKFHERYWRAVIVDEFDGNAWQQSAFQQSVHVIAMQSPAKPQHLTQGERLFNYDVTLLPNNTQYVPTLALINAISQQPRYQTAQSQYSDTVYYMTQDHQVVTSHTQSLTGYYQATSGPGARPEPRPLTETEYRQYTQTPSASTAPTNPLTQAWVKQLLQTHNDLDAILNAFAQLMLENDFSYTLQPPFMPNNMIDAFLFEHQTGFCSHYASALGYVLRLAGFPTRLVAGYQGGQQIDDTTLLVYQYDAHAWLEVFHPMTGWQRVDPTAMIAPQRITEGLAQALSQPSEFMEQSGVSLAKYAHVPGVQQLYRIMQRGSAFWHTEVLGFNQQNKHRLLASLTDTFQRQHAMLLVYIGIGLVITVTGYILWRTRFNSMLSAHQRGYLQARQLCMNAIAKQQHLNSADILRLPPQAFLTWSQAYISDNAFSIMQQITQYFIQHEYAAMSSERERASKYQTYRQLNRALKSAF